MALVRLVNAHDPNCLFFMETKCSRRWVEKIGDKIGLNNLFVVDLVGRAGGLAILWNNEINFDVMWNSDRIVVSSVKDHRGMNLGNMVNCYSTSYLAKKEKFWGQLREIVGFLEGF